jgi:hypothetical protein
MALRVRVPAGSDNSFVAFVIPVKAEQATLGPLFHAKAGEVVEITQVWEAFIADESSDGRWGTIEQLATEDAEHVKAIRSCHEAGKTAAQAAGYSIYFEPLDEYPRRGVFNQPEPESVLAHLFIPFRKPVAQTEEAWRPASLSQAPAL